MINDIIAEMLSEGHTEDEIIDYLLDCDYSIAEIVTALAWED